MVFERTYIAVIDGTVYDRIGSWEAGPKIINLLYSRDRRTVIVNYLVIITMSGLPEFLKLIGGAEFTGVRPRAILRQDIAAITDSCPRYEIMAEQGEEGKVNGPDAAK